jgi:DNA-binding response OmpR family regulator
MTEQIHTLVVDDEERIRHLLQEILSRDGHKVVTVASGEEALGWLQETFFDLVMLDLRLGWAVDGHRVLEAIRWRWPETKVIILTAHSSLESTLAAIREGVDGYLLKPARAEEIRQTIQRAFARRKRSTQSEDSGQEKQALQVGSLIVDRKKHLATLGGQPLELTPAEFRLLVCLMENASRIATPQELVLAVQDYRCEDEREAREIIRWHVHRLRRKVEPDPSKPQYILNVRGVGYTFGLVEEIA